MLFSIFNFLIISCISSTTFQKPLSKEEETYYIDAMNKGDKEAKNILIERNLRLVAHIAKKYNNGTGYNEELVSIGTIGLIKGINSFNSDKNTKIATYVARCIENEILMSLRSGKKTKNNISLQEPIGFDKDGNEVSILDKLSDSKENVEENVEVQFQVNEMLEKMDYLLSDKEKYILKHRYGLNTKEKTQRELSSDLNISRSYVSRIEKKALQKLRKQMS